MKRIRVYATVLGLLVCTAVANAQQKLALQGLSNAQVNAITSGNKLVPLPPTDQNGTLDLTALGLGNITNKPLTIYVDQCGNQPPVAFLVFPGQQPPDKPDCKRQKVGVAVWTGSGWKVEPGEPGPYSLQVIGAAPVPQVPVVEGPSPFAVAFSGGLGFSDFTDFSHECQNVSTGITCSASPKAFLWSLGVQMYFGPAYLRVGGMKGNDVSVTQTGTFEGGAFSDQESARFHAGEVVAGFNAFCVHNRVIVSPEGGVLVGTLNLTETGSTTSGSTTGSSTFRDSAGFVAPVWGGEATFKVRKNLATGFRFDHGLLRIRGQSSSQNFNLYQVFVKYVFGTPGSIFHIGH